MTTQTVPLKQVPNQQVTVTLNNQRCTINVYQYDSGLYVDLLVNDTAIVTSVLGLNANLIVRDAYLGFNGDLAFFDTQGSNDPDYAGLDDGSGVGRYALIYLGS
jgi:hypothetical protein